MDTRNKILTLAAALERQAPWPSPLVVASGTFDVLRAAHVQELLEVRKRTAAEALLVVVLPTAPQLMPQRARAELVAALCMVDYVVTADYGDLNHLISALQPVAFVSLEAAHARRTRELIEHVHSRQTR